MGKLNGIFPSDNISGADRAIFKECSVRKLNRQNKATYVALSGVRIRLALFRPTFGGIFIEIKKTM